jgi:hypothetical protein
LDLEKYNNYIDLFIPSIHDAGRIFNQEVALNILHTFNKRKNNTTCIGNINKLFFTSYWRNEF